MFTKCILHYSVCKQIRCRVDQTSFHSIHCKLIYVDRHCQTAPRVEMSGLPWVHELTLALKVKRSTLCNVSAAIVLMLILL